MIRAYKEAINFAKTHYENFPVVSFLIPKKLQQHVAIIYWFARSADDLADEGNISQGERLQKLNEFESRLTELLKGNFNSTFEEALSSTIKEKNLSPQLFYDLLIAFKQDVIKTRYKDFDELLNYCRHSANPVGRLILELFSVRNEKAYYFSDKICTALQLTNFFQDLKIDYQKGRIYLPQDEMSRFFVSEKMFAGNETNLYLRNLLEFNIERTKKMFIDGRKLLFFLKGRLKREINWTILGGEAILSKIKNLNYDVLNKRPALTKSDYFNLFVKSILY